MGKDQHPELIRNVSSAPEAQVLGVLYGRDPGQDLPLWVVPPERAFSLRDIWYLAWVKIAKGLEGGGGSETPWIFGLP